MAISSYIRAGSICLLVALASCSKDPAIEYRLSPEQLAWQGYRVGEVLRFGNERNAQVRTYRVMDVQDRMETQFMGVVGPTLPFASAEPPLYQQVTVMVQRTDSVFRPYPVLQLSLNFDPDFQGQPQLRADAEWETSSRGRLPLNEVIHGSPIDTTMYAAKLLPSVTLGPVTYASVLYLTNRAPGAVSFGARSISHLYYARGKGVVAFEETGSGLWYRLP